VLCRDCGKSKNQINEEDKLLLEKIIRTSLGIYFSGIDGNLQR